MSPVNQQSLLLVEDNPVDARMLELLVRELPGRPFRPTRAASLTEAVELAGSIQPVLVILDLNLPDSAGLATLTRLLGQIGRVPIVVLTGSDDDDTAIQSVRLGAQDFLIKGQVDSRGLSRTLQYALERHRLLQELEEARSSAAHRATHDGLTGLPNRALFLDRLGLGVARAERRTEKLAVVFMDLDGFKQVNDTLGHNVGDQALVEVARRLGPVVRRTDTLARLAGDEFTVLFESLPDRATAQILADRLVQQFDQPFMLGEISHQLGVSLGMALYPDDGTDADSLLRTADQAMYQAKGLRKEPPALAER